MKKYFLFLLLATSVSVFSQTDYDKISLANDDEARAANKYALEAANYVYSNPFIKDNPQRIKSVRFIVKWMEATPDYMFIFDETVNEKIVKGSEELLPLYMVCMTKFVLENEAKAKDDGVVMVGTVKLLLAYCENPKNNFKMPEALQKLSDANKKGELIKALQ